jgi:hypothetical protein
LEQLLSHCEKALSSGESRISRMKADKEKTVTNL